MDVSAITPGKQGLEAYLTKLIGDVRLLPGIIGGTWMFCQQEIKWVLSYIEIHLLKAMETGHKRPGRLCPVLLQDRLSAVTPPALRNPKLPVNRSE